MEVTSFCGPTRTREEVVVGALLVADGVKGSTSGAVRGCLVSVPRTIPVAKATIANQESSIKAFRRVGRRRWDLEKHRVASREKATMWVLSSVGIQARRPLLAIVHMN